MTLGSHLPQSRLCAIIEVPLGLSDIAYRSQRIEIMDHEKFMREAIAEASLAFQKGDVPVVEPSGGGDSRDTG
jgi:hypothetical protein